MFGELLDNAWNDASQAAKSVASAIATGAQRVGQEAAVIGKTTASAVSSAASWAEQKTVQAAKAVGNEVVAVAQDGAALVGKAYYAVKTGFNDVAAAAKYVGCTAENLLVKSVVGVVGAVLTNPLLEPLEQALMGDSANLPNDGAQIGAGCQNQGSQGGVVPQCPNGSSAPREQATYVNGINTTQVALCASMQNLANATCAEVTGVYNASGGMMADLSECLSNIAKNSDTPAVDTLERSMYASLSQDPPQPMTIYAHSQGGLITQEALARLKSHLAESMGQDEAEARMSQLTVNSFGTAQQGWPVGPDYTQYTNEDDPVPGAIAGAQLNHPFATYLDNADVPADQQNTFFSPHLNPIDSHSMDNVYIPQMIQINGQPNCCQ